MKFLKRAGKLISQVAASFFKFLTYDNSRVNLKFEIV